MLASLLPGLRDLRTPLTVGYLWLICAWLWFHDVLPKRGTARGAIADLYDLDRILPPATSLAALTFIAYFLGSIVELDIAAARWLDWASLNRTAWEAVADRFRILVRPRLEGEQVTMQDARYRAAVAAWHRTIPGRTAKRVTLVMHLDGVLGPSEYRVGTTRAPELPVDKATIRQLPAIAIATLYALWDELPDLATRLLIERPAVFDRYDRLLAEASIRINMFLPVVALVTTLALRASWLWWLGLIACAALLYQGLVQRSRALAVVLDSVATRLIESPTMVAVTEALDGETSVSAPPATP
ncbi:hypothetical protein [Streptomyces sp. CA-106110]|uniref:hypothetical protein n=1 Tax=Streptomyces sp. CA-106110 TaxID=3240044 RepID=UPI003D8D116E